MDRCFIDTNVLIYADDLDAGTKTQTAQSIIAKALVARSGVVSTQVLQEFFSVATRKLGVKADIARRKVELIARLDLITINLNIILAAIDLQRMYAFSFWDALVLQAAAVAKCRTLLTEDLQHGQVIQGVRIENPFRA